MTPPKLILILSENWTLTSPRDLRSLVGFAVQAEDAGFDAVMVSEHVVLGPDAGADGLPANPRDYALPGNQDPTTPWPARSCCCPRSPRRPPGCGWWPAPSSRPCVTRCLLAKDLATLDLLSEGRLVVQPTVSWHRSEYDALGVPFGSRGALLDEHLAAWDVLWRDAPASFEGTFYRFHDVFLEPKPFRPAGPVLWFGGSSLHDRLIRRIATHGHGFNPLGRPAPEDVSRLRHAMAAVGRSIEELEMVGGTRGVFPDPSSVADLEQALSSIPEQVGGRFHVDLHQAVPVHRRPRADERVLSRGRGTRLALVG